MIILKTLFLWATNLFILILLNQIIPDFQLNKAASPLVITAVLFTAFNSYFRPLIRYFFTPVIILTLGLFGIAINAGLLWFLDFSTKNITIERTSSLVLAAVIVSLINLIVAAFTNVFFKKK